MLDSFKNLRGMWGLVALAIALTFYAGAKQGKIDFMRTDVDVQYFCDAGSYITNDCVVLNFMTQIIPDNAPIFVETRELGMTNETDWVIIAEGVVGEFKKITIQYQNATNNNFRVYSNWTPGPTVHTNGVLNVKWGVEHGGLTEIKIGAIALNTEVELMSESIDETNSTNVLLRSNLIER